MSSQVIPVNVQVPAITTAPVVATVSAPRVQLSHGWSTWHVDDLSGRRLRNLAQTYASTRATT